MQKLKFARVFHTRLKDGWRISVKFIIKKTSDLMIRGGDFYAVWDELNQMWSMDEDTVTRILDGMMDEYYEEHKNIFGSEKVQIMYMHDGDTKTIDKWHHYITKQLRDRYQPLDETLNFSNTPKGINNYSTRVLNYPLEKGECPAYTKLISTLYSDENRHKIEWCIGSVINGDSKKIQKFLVLYGEGGTGKSTVLHIIEKLTKGYYCNFSSEQLTSSNGSFALEPFKDNPLVGIQHDGKLSKIESNTRLNSLVSHEEMLVNEKHKNMYSMQFNAFLFIGTNDPVKITNAKSGLIRRLIDASPTGNKVSKKEYDRLMAKIPFELGAIAWHCKEVYEADPHYYDSYVPKAMISATDDFYNFVMDNYRVFKENDSTTLTSAYTSYVTYCKEANLPFGPISRTKFKEELKNYFRNYNDRVTVDGTRIRSYFSGFKSEKFEEENPEKKKEDDIPLLELIEQPSIFDKIAADYPAQYATNNSKQIPMKSWDKVTTTLSDLDTSKVHYVKLPPNHIVIDFDLKNDKKEKDYARNLAAASNWPNTYAEVSKGGAGIHLHYIYAGDPTNLMAKFSEDVEIKVFTGNGSLRRKLTKCNNLPIATISSNLPTKGEKVVDKNIVESDKTLRATIASCIYDKKCGSTRQNINMIHHILENAYESGLKYDVSDLYDDVYKFACKSSNQSRECQRLVYEMHFKSDEPSEQIDYNKVLDALPPNIVRPLVFFDIEVFPNLFLVNWKFAEENYEKGKPPEKPLVRMINPKPAEIERLAELPLVGFNCRRYDNHILWAALMGYSNEELYRLSKRIISGDKNAFFGEAYNLSYTDIYDFASSANKKSLKKLEIEMKFTHKELNMNWDEEVPEDKWEEVAAYCDNDVLATEAAFHYLQSDFLAREILADITGMNVNTTTNTLTTKFIFGDERNPQSEFCYRDLSKPVFELDPDVQKFLCETCPEMMAQRHGEAQSLLPYWDGYKCDRGVSTYKYVNEENPDPLLRKVGEGGWVYSEPGMYGNVALLDITSMHPSSTIAECLFGPYFTKQYRDIVYGRVHIKHEAWSEVDGMMGGKLAPYIEKCKSGEISSSDLANALKTAINSVYGLTAASFKNPFNDPRNKDNIVAKRGSLFMIDLKEAVEKQGFKVAHIKTDSIKIPDADNSIIEFVMRFGKKYGYTFEHEATYDRMCLVNKAVYIAKYKDPDECEKLYGYIPDKNKKKGGKWSATGDQFKVPYVFKSLFSHEEIELDDLRQVFQVAKGSLYLDMNESLPDVSQFEKELDKLESNYKKGLISDTTFTKECERLQPEIDKGHDLHFIGRIGSFFPVKKMSGGGILYRVHEGKNYAAAGTTGYRWQSFDNVQGNEEVIDMSYYDKLVTDAIRDINKYGDFEWFVSDDPYIPWMFIRKDCPSELPFL